MANESASGTGSEVSSADRGTQVVFHGEAGSDAIPIVDPATIEFPADGNEQPRRKRGRPRGSSGGTSNAQGKKQATNDLTGLLLSLHLMGSTLTSIPELAIEKEEAKLLSDAIAEVNDFYGGLVLPKNVMVWSQFLMTLGTVYGTRAMAYSLRIKHEADGKPKTVDIKPNRVM